MLLIGVALQAALCGVGLALGFPVAVLLLFPRGGRARWALLALPPIVLGGYWAAHRLYADHYGDPVNYGVAILVALLPRWHTTVSMAGHMMMIGPTVLVDGFTWSTRRYPDAISLGIGTGFVAAMISGLLGARRSRPGRAEGRLTMVLIAT